MAWHSDMDGDYQAEVYVCHACTAIQGGEEKVRYPVVRTGRDFTARPLPPFVLGVTTTDS